MKVKKIKFERSGGFANIRLAAEIEPDEMAEDQRQQLFELLDELDLEETLEKLSRQASAPDDFTYHITVETKEAEYKTDFGNSMIPDNVQPLIELLEGIAKRQMRKKG